MQFLYQYKNIYYKNELNLNNSYTVYHMKTLVGHDVKIFNDNIEDNALEQIKELLSIDVFLYKEILYG